MEKRSPGKTLGHCRLHLVCNSPVEPQIGRQLCSVELREEAGGRGRWGVQLADGLRLMKWIMRGARAGFHAKKRRKKRERQTVTCSGLDCSEPPGGQGAEKASPGQGLFLRCTPGQVSSLASTSPAFEWSRSQAKHPSSSSPSVVLKQCYTQIVELKSTFQTGNLGTRRNRIFPESHW